MKTLMRYIFCLILMMCCLGTMQAVSSENCTPNKQSIEGQRIDQIITDARGVFLLVDGFWIGSQGMQATPDGILVLENGEWIPLQKALNNEEYAVWRCRRCKSWNPGNTYYCFNCGAPIGS